MDETDVRVAVAVTVEESSQADTVLLTDTAPVPSPSLLPVKNKDTVKKDARDKWDMRLPGTATSKEVADALCEAFPVCYYVIQVRLR